jgi:dipeptidyl aminopeptidase/acylaminoacyl peptidase
MGEVYRARDTRLRRDVAVKVIHSALSTPDFVHRLDREARTAGSLNHPNILAVYDVGSEGGAPYVVSELLEGESLRARLDRGPLPYRKALEFGIQIANALAAAHEKGIQHRDVKPANVFVTSDGRIKLLDFGLARAGKAEAAADPDDSTASPATRPGVARGTAGYMSPEQVLGEPQDARSDIFALGIVLYEMLTGARAFKRASPVEAMSAVLTDEPVDPLVANPSLPAAAAAAVRRCLEKNKEERFQSARDLAFHLKHLVQGTMQGPVPDKGRSRARTLAVAAALAGLALAAGAWVAGSRLAARAAPVYQQLTFDRGRIGGARFARAEGAIVYSLTQGGGAPDVRLVLAGSPESRALGHSGADVLATRNGELALSVHRRYIGGERFSGTLATVPLNGGTPKELMLDVEDGDWDPSGTAFAAVRSSGFGGDCWLEYPAGKRLYRAAGSIHSVRVSPDGARVAFIEDAAGLGTGGAVRVVDRAGAVMALTPRWVSARGLAWSPDGREVWFTAADARANRSLRAVDLSGRTRLVAESPGSLTLWDIAPDGRVLLTRDDERRSLVGIPPGEKRERELSAFDDAGLAALSRDGKTLLFGDRFGVYLRPTSGGLPLKLGFKDVFPDDLSPDGRLVLATSASTNQLLLLPTGPGDAQPLAPHGITQYHGAAFFPDGEHILFNSWVAEDGGPGAGDRTTRPRSYITDRGGAPPRPVTLPGVWALSISPDGRTLACLRAGEGISLWPVAADGGGGTPVAGSTPGDRPVAWTADGAALWVFRRGEVPARIDRLEIASGQRQEWKRLVPPDPSGVFSITDLRVTPNGESYFYSYRRILSELYVATGMR